MSMTASAAYRLRSDWRNPLGVRARARASRRRRFQPGGRLRRYGRLSLALERAIPSVHRHVEGREEDVHEEGLPRWRFASRCASAVLEMADVAVSRAVTCERASPVAQRASGGPPGNSSRSTPMIRALSGYVSPAWRLDRASSRLSARPASDTSEETTVREWTAPMADAKQRQETFDHRPVGNRRNIEEHRSAERPVE